MANQKLRMAAVLSFGLGGHSVSYPQEGYSNCSLSGYDSPESFQLEMDRGKYASEFDYSKCVVIDKRAILRSDPRLSIASPLLKVELAPGTVERFVDRETAARMLPSLGGAFAFLACAAVVDKQYSGLDYVATDVYAAIWRKNGARMGRIVNNKIVWE